MFIVAEQTQWGSTYYPGQKQMDHTVITLHLEPAELCESAQGSLKG